ncbi:MAG: hypothetical protein KY451_09980 [Actinobacteria bacterium]|nr:hypothetical protein [Actinomycetota bacterium]
MDRDVADTLQVMTLEIRAGFAEVKSLIAESRGSTIDLRAGMSELRADMTTRLDTLFAALAEFRAEYQERTHGDA